MPPETRFNGSVEEISYYASRWRWALILLGCLIFSAIGIFAIKTNAPVRGAFILIFFGFGSLVSAVPVLFPRSTSLRLTHDGFHMRALFRSHFFRWSEVSEFHVGTIVTMRARNKMVMFNILDGKDSKLRALSRELAGYDGGISDNYGMSHEKLCEMMNEWRSRSRLAD